MIARGSWFAPPHQGQFLDQLVKGKIPGCEPRVGALEVVLLRRVEQVFLTLPGTPSPRWARQPGDRRAGRHPAGTPPDRPHGSCEGAAVGGVGDGRLAP